MHTKIVQWHAAAHCRIVSPFRTVALFCTVSIRVDTGGTRMTVIVYAVQERVQERVHCGLLLPVLFLICACVCVCVCVCACVHVCVCVCAHVYVCLLFDAYCTFHFLGSPLSPATLTLTLTRFTPSHICPYSTIAVPATTSALTSNSRLPCFFTSLISFICMREKEAIAVFFPSFFTLFGRMHVHVHMHV
mmetsp:Transcript_7361/g.19100  ORF Transcript_7361/g.19100 Transcript_7361/m.19100 type:complete len:190 (+) Transcript_7361:913-1482(+)